MNASKKAVDTLSYASPDRLAFQLEVSRKHPALKRPILKCKVLEHLILAASDDGEFDLD